MTHSQAWIVKCKCWCELFLRRIVFASVRHLPELNKSNPKSYLSQVSEWGLTTERSGEGFGSCNINKNPRILVFHSALQFNEIEKHALEREHIKRFAQDCAATKISKLLPSNLPTSFPGVEEEGGTASRWATRSTPRQTDGWLESSCAGDRTANVTIHPRYPQLIYVSWQPRVSRHTRRQSPLSSLKSWLHTESEHVGLCC